MNSSALIKIQNLNKAFGKVHAADNICLEVNEGDIFGFLGPNGAGKTTTIRLILNLLKPDSGEIEIFGKKLSNDSVEIRQRCGYLPGNFSAYTNLNGNEFLKLCADLRNIPYKTNPNLLDRFGLSESNLKQKIKHLSHGTLQKIGIVQAFFHKPELLILDEPTIGLDPLMQEAFYELLEESRKQGSTIFLSSHNLSEVERICHRLAIIRKGKIEKTDSIENLRKLISRKLRFSITEALGDISLPGANLLKQQGMSYEFIIHGKIGPILQKLSELPLSEVILPEPSLEEIFMNFYQDKKND